MSSAHDIGLKSSSRYGSGYHGSQINENSPSLITIGPIEIRDSTDRMREIKEEIIEEIRLERTEKSLTVQKESNDSKNVVKD